MPVQVYLSDVEFVFILPHYPEYRKEMTTRNANMSFQNTCAEVKASVQNRNMSPSYVHYLATVFQFVVRFDSIYLSADSLLFGNRL